MSELIETIQDWNEKLEQCGCCPMPEFSAGFFGRRLSVNFEDTSFRVNGSRYSTKVDRRVNYSGSSYQNWTGNAEIKTVVNTITIDGYPQSQPNSPIRSGGGTYTESYYTNGRLTTQITESYSINGSGTAWNYTRRRVDDGRTTSSSSGSVTSINRGVQSTSYEGAAGSFQAECQSELNTIINTVNWDSLPEYGMSNDSIRSSILTSGTVSVQCDLVKGGYIIHPLSLATTTAKVVIDVKKINSDIGYPETQQESMIQSNVVFDYQGAGGQGLKSDPSRRIGGFDLLPMPDIYFSTTLNQIGYSETLHVNQRYFGVLNNPYGVKPYVEPPPYIGPPEEEY